MYCQIKIMNELYSFYRKYNFLGISSPPVAERFCARIERREVPGSILGRDCRLSHLELSVVFSETRVSTGQDPLERPQRRAFLPIGPGPTCGQLAYPYNQPTNQLLGVRVLQILFYYPWFIFISIFSFFCINRRNYSLRKNF